jgi:hypothetical protein
VITTAVLSRTDVSSALSTVPEDLFVEELTTSIVVMPGKEWATGRSWPIDARISRQRIVAVARSVDRRASLRARDEARHGPVLCSARERNS